MASAARRGPSSPPSWRPPSAAPRRPRSEAERPQVLIVRDTRESGPMLEAALAAGIAAAGGDALLAGVLPTPAAAILVRRLGLDLAAVVSASHNPYRDNGIKFFSAAGTKLPDEVEARIEALMEGGRTARRRRAGPDRGAARGRGRLRPRARRRLPDRPQRPQGRARLRPRGHLPGRAADLRAARRDGGRGDRRRPRRAQHQRRCRLDPRRCARRTGSPPPTPRSASPSTAMATACSPSTPTDGSTTATS